MSGVEGQLQYEGLQDLCFTCGKYGHKEVKCPSTITKSNDNKENDDNNGASKEESGRGSQGVRRLLSDHGWLRKRIAADRRGARRVI